MAIDKIYNRKYYFIYIYILFFKSIHTFSNKSRTNDENRLVSLATISVEKQIADILETKDLINDFTSLRGMPVNFKSEIPIYLLPIYLYTFIPIEFFDTYGCTFVV